MTTNSDLANSLKLLGQIAGCFALMQKGNGENGIVYLAPQRNALSGMAIQPF